MRTDGSKAWGSNRKSELLDLPRSRRHFPAAYFRHRGEVSLLLRCKFAHELRELVGRDRDVGAALVATLQDFRCHGLLLGGQKADGMLHVVDIHGYRLVRLRIRRGPSGWGDGVVSRA